MSKAIVYTVDIILAIILLFLFPLLYYGQKQDSLVQSVVKMDTANLVNEVRGTGYLTKEQYDAYQDSLSRTKNVYDIEIEHRHLCYEPEYRLRSLEEILDEQNASYHGPNHYTHRTISTEVPEVVDPIDNSGQMNTETNESILATARRTPANPGHVHTADCYLGHKHEGEPIILYPHKHSYSCIEYNKLIYYSFTCYSCRKSGTEFVASYYWNRETNTLELGSSNPTGSLRCHFCNSDNLATTQHISYGYSCGFDYDLNGDGLDDKVGRDHEYIYRRSGPVDDKTKATYTNGCYRYHVHSKSTQWYGLSGKEIIGEMYIAGGLPKLCQAHKYYSITLSHRERYWNNTVVYRLEADGLFYFEGAYDINTPVDGSRFPQIITMNSLFYWTNESSFISSWENATNSKFLDSSSDYRTSATLSGEINNCSETNGGRWYTTCGYTEDNTLRCHEKVIALTPTHPIQKVYTNDPLITTATATYLDGSTDIVLCSTSFLAATPVQNQTVTLTYNYTAGAQSYSNHTTILVTVVPRNKTCTNGHIYNLHNDGSDPGCPYCKSWLRSLTLEYPTANHISIYKGTTLPENGVTLLAVYLDGRREYVTSEYVDNLDMHYVGVQNVTLSYKGKYTTLNVTTKRNITLCEVCGRYYELYPDDTSPGCPYCAARTPIFTGNIMEYYKTIQEEDILKVLYEGKGTYYFSNPDYLMLTVRNKGSSWGRRLLRNLYPNLGTEYILINYGGYIREEVE